MSGSSSNNVKTEIVRLVKSQKEKASLLAYFTKNQDKQAEAFSDLGTFEADEDKLSYLRAFLPDQPDATVQKLLSSNDPAVKEQSTSSSEGNHNDTHLPESTQQLIPPRNVKVDVHHKPSSERIQNDTLLPENVQPSQDVKVNVSERIQDDTYLPKNAPQLLRFYELWNRRYSEWPSLNEFSDHLHGVSKARVHSSFKNEIKVLRTLFTEEHPAQLRLIQMEGQLKMRQKSRVLKKANRRRIAKATELLTKEATVKRELEIAQSSVILGGYRRINSHYDQFHDASSQLVKRNSSFNNESLKSNHKRARKYLK